MTSPMSGKDTELPKGGVLSEFDLLKPGNDVGRVAPRRLAAPAVAM